MALSLENEEQGSRLSRDHAPSITAVTSGQSHAPGPDYAAEAYKACLYGRAESNQQRSVASALILANGLKGELLGALKRLMDAERAVSKADREAIIAVRFTGPDQAAAFAAQDRAGRELTAAWIAARHAIIRAEGLAPSSGDQSLGSSERQRAVAHAPRDTPEPSSPPEHELSKLSGGWEPIETAPFDPEWSVLGWEPGMDAAVEMVWRQDMRRWLTRGGRDIAPTHWHPLPALPQDHTPVRGREGSEFGQTSSSTQCADAQARPTGGEI